MVVRRTVLAGALAGGVLLIPGTSRFAGSVALAAAPTNRRFVFIIQRGAADGLGTVAPVGDPAFASQRGALAGEFSNAPRLDDTFALHPALQSVERLYRDKQALFFHAVASPYRERSHFDGQNVLETGGGAAYRIRDGWLNRLLAILPAQDGHALALAPTIPLVLRGEKEVLTFAPSKLPVASDDLLARVTGLYEADDELAPVWRRAVEARAMGGGEADSGEARNAGRMAGQLLGADSAARIAVIETGGWDTHSQQRVRLARQLQSLDAMIDALRTELGPLWADTAVLVATEFGRTVRVNGTGGTDHGTGALAMLLGGTIRGGRVAADWPGLAAGSLHENRDLRPTADLQSVLASAVSAHFGIDPARTASALFPEARSIARIDGIV